MAFSFALIHKTATTELYEVIEDADADVGGDIAHTLGRVPDIVILTPLLPAAHVSLSTVSAITNLLVSLLSTNGGGSGDADPQLRVFLGLAPNQLR